MVVGGIVIETRWFGMVGGIVIEVAWFEGKVFVDLRDSQRSQRCAIYVKRNADSEQIEFGDRLWWQGDVAFWTPQGEARVDVRIPRVGYSGVELYRNEPADG